MQTWQLREAEASLNHIVDEALTGGPQIIARGDVAVAVIISYEQFRQESGERQKLSEFFANSPLAGVELDIERDNSPVRSPPAP